VLVAAGSDNRWPGRRGWPSGAAVLGGGGLPSAAKTGATVRL